MSLHKKLTERNYCSQTEKQNIQRDQSSPKMLFSESKQDDQFVN